MAKEKSDLLQLLANAKKYPDMEVMYRSPYISVDSANYGKIKFILPCIQKEICIDEMKKTYSIDVEYGSSEDIGWYGRYDFFDNRFLIIDVANSLKFLDYLVDFSQNHILSTSQISNLLNELVDSEILTQKTADNYKEKIKTQLTLAEHEIVALSKNSIDEFIIELGYYWGHNIEGNIKEIFDLLVQINTMVPEHEEIERYLDLDKILRNFNWICSSRLFDDPTYENQAIIEALIQNTTIKKLIFRTHHSSPDHYSQNLVNYLSRTKSLECLEIATGREQLRYSSTRGRDEFNILCSGLSQNKSLKNILFCSPILNDDRMDILLSALERNTDMPLEELKIVGSITDKSAIKIIEFLTKTKSQINIILEGFYITQPVKERISSIIQSNKVITGHTGPASQSEFASSSCRDLHQATSWIDSQTLFEPLPSASKSISKDNYDLSHSFYTDLP